MNPLERLIYVIVRAAVTAYLDVLNERSKAVEEKPNDADLVRADRFADAIRLREQSDIAGQKDPTPSSR